MKLHITIVFFITCKNGITIVGSSLGSAKKGVPAELARESEDTCVASAKDKLTLEMVVEKVNDIVGEIRPPP